jgi:hypothetical protein
MFIDKASKNIDFSSIPINIFLKNLANKNWVRALWGAGKPQTRDALWSHHRNKDHCND